MRQSVEGKSRRGSGTSGGPTDPSCESVEDAHTVDGDEFQVGELSRVLGSVCAW